MKKVLITGCSGYIGTHLYEMLKDEYEVHGLDEAGPRVEIEHFYNIDITKPFKIDGIEFDAVVHLAGLVKVDESQQRPISYYLTNLNGTMNVLNKIKTKNFIFASTGLAQYCNNPYAVSKRAAEDVVKSYIEMANVNYTTFRFYNVIGSSVILPTNPDGLMRKLMEASTTGSFTIYGDQYATRDGTCLKDYIHVDEVCHAIRTAIEKPANQIECLGHGRGYTVREMAMMFQKANNVAFEIKVGQARPGEVGNYVLDTVSPYMKDLFTLEELLKLSV